MLRNHLKFAFRLFIKDGFYSVLNLIGLVIGISCGIMVVLIVNNDLNYDKSHLNHERIYRFSTRTMAPGVDFNTCVAPRPLPGLMMEMFDDIENYVRFESFGQEMVQYVVGSEETFYEAKVLRADTSLFSVFTHTLVAGNPEKALEGKNNVVISESMAHKIFGMADPMNQTLIFFGDQPYAVSAVFKDLPDNVHLKYDMVLSGFDEVGQFGDLSDGDPRFSELFWNPDIYAYFMFKEGYDPQKFDSQFEVVYNKFYKAFGDKIEGNATPNLEPLADIHFHSTLEWDEPQGNLSFLYTFAFIGLFILILACINYTNLTTARAINRVGEVGIRKALGYGKNNLFFTIFLEAFLMAFCAVILAIVFCYALLELTTFNALINKNLSLNLFQDPIIMPSIVGVTLFVTLLSGLYPALYIPSIPVVSALKGIFKSDQLNVNIRKGLIVFQFVVSLFVIMSTLIMGRQIDYVRNKPLGFDKENVMILRLPGEADEKKTETLKDQLLAYSSVFKVASSWGVPGNGVDHMVMRVENNKGELEQQELNTLFTSGDYLNTMGLQLVEGRNFDPDRATDYSLKFIVNETFVQEMGWGQQALGKKVKYFHGTEDGEVIGVIKDFNTTSLHNKIEPLIIISNEDLQGYLHIRINSENIPTTIATVKDLWESYNQESPFEYEFLDAQFDAQYKADQDQYALIGILSFLCIAISILGLIGLAAFNAGQRTKEIGIRKTLGASVPELLVLFSRSYAKLILLAFVLAVPLANYMVTEWMGTFAYQMDIPWYYFLWPGIAVFALAILVVSLQSLKSANLNPVDALKDE